MGKGAIIPTGSDASLGSGDRRSKRPPSCQSSLNNDPMNPRSLKWNRGMALNFQQIKRDFTKHKAKSGVLGVLALTMIGLFVKAAVEMRPRSAVAETAGRFRDRHGGGNGEHW